jgi:hypothetical protein
MAILLCKKIATFVCIINVQCFFSNFGYLSMLSPRHFGLGHLVIQDWLLFQ